MLAAGYFAVVLLAANPGAAETDATPKPVEIRFDGPDGCSSATAFLNSLRSRSNRVRAAQGDEPRTTVEVHLSRDHARVLGELRIIDDHEETNTRRVQGASCSDVVQALSLTAAIALDPTALLSAPSAVADGETASDETPAKTTPPPPARPEPAEIVTSPPPPRATPSHTPDPSTEIGAHALALAILSGGLSPGVGIEARKTFRREHTFRPAFGLSFAYARNDVLQAPQQAQAALWTAAASLCPVRLAASIVAVSPCAQFYGGWLSATGRDVTHVGSASRSWFAAGLTVRADVFLGGGVWLQVEGGAAVLALKRRFFATVPANVIAETPTISPVLSIGFVWGT